MEKTRTDHADCFPGPDLFGITCVLYRLALIADQVIEWGTTGIVLGEE